MRPVLGAAVVACLAAQLLAASGGEVQAAVCLALLGVALVLRAVGVNSLAQLIAEDHHRGSFMAVVGATLRLGAAVSCLLLGVLADVVGSNRSLPTLLCWRSSPSSLLCGACAEAHGGRMLEEETGVSRRE